MNLSNVYPYPVDALESAEVAPFHALDEDITGKETTVIQMKWLNGVGV
jgi:hypothetical protein